MSQTVRHDWANEQQFPIHQKSHIYWPFLPASLEQFLRVIWGAVSQNFCSKFLVLRKNTQARSKVREIPVDLKARLLKVALECSTPSLAAAGGSKTTQPASGREPHGGLLKEAEDQKPTSAQPWLSCTQLSRQQDLETGWKLLRNPAGKFKNNRLESVLMRWMKLEPIIQSEVSQKEKHQYSILTHIYGI